VLPADLEVLEFVAKRSLRTKGKTVHLGITIEMDARPGGLNRAIRRVKVRTLEEWQKRWDAGRTARLVHKFLPDVSERMKRSFLHFDHYTTQLVTGHGQFRAKLHSLGLRDDPDCACGLGNQTAEHIIWECPLLNDVRDEMMRGMVVRDPQPIWFGNLCESEANFRCFRGFAAKWVERWDLLSRPGLAPVD
jgi:hypothetical protein